MPRLIVTQQLSPGLSEADFTTVVINHARLAGWLVHHDRPAKRQSGTYSTPIQGDKGFPDLCMAHGEFGLIFAELKVPGGRMRAEQYGWLDALTNPINPIERCNPRTIVRVWWPKDWLTEIVPALNGELER